MGGRLEPGLNLIDRVCSSAPMRRRGEMSGGSSRLPLDRRVVLRSKDPVL